MFINVFKYCTSICRGGRTSNIYPLLHIGDVSAKEMVEQNIKRIGLLGTKQTMEQDFYKSRLAKYNIETIIPNDEERTFIHHVILDELSRGSFQKHLKKVITNYKIINSKRR